MARNILGSGRRSAVEEGSEPVSRNEVARVAYQLFEQRGRLHGFDQQDWFRAEEIVRQRRRSGNW
jgi:hypothetical protein